LSLEGGQQYWWFTRPDGLAPLVWLLLAGVGESHAARELRNRTRDSGWVPADSLTSVMTLDGRHGDEMEVRVWGPGAAEVIRDVIALVDKDFQ
jgi:phosphocarrier protein FPr